MADGQTFMYNLCTYFVIVLFILVSHWPVHLLSIGPAHTVLLDFSLTVKAVPHECVIRTSQP